MNRSFYPIPSVSNSYIIHAWPLVKSRVPIARKKEHITNVLLVMSSMHYVQSRNETFFSFAPDRSVAFRFFDNLSDD